MEVCNVLLISDENCLRNTHMLTTTAESHLRPASSLHAKFARQTALTLLQRLKSKKTLQHVKAVCFRQTALTCCIWQTALTLKLCNTLTTSVCLCQQTSSTQTARSWSNLKIVQRTYEAHDQESYYRALLVLV